MGITYSPRWAGVRDGSVTVMWKYDWSVKNTSGLASSTLLLFMTPLDVDAEHLVPGQLEDRGDKPPGPGTRACPFQERLLVLKVKFSGPQGDVFWSSR